TLQSRLYRIHKSARTGPAPGKRTATARKNAPKISGVTEMALRNNWGRMLASASCMALTVGVSAARAQEATAPALEEVTVQGVRGFSSEVTQVGAFRGAQIIDTPATIAVLPRDLLDAQQMQGLNDVLKNVAGANGAQTGQTVTSNESIRGIALDNRN